MPINILIVDDHELARQGLRMLISAVDGYSVVGELDHGAAVIPFISENTVDIVLLDLNLGVMNGADLLSELVGRMDATIIVVSGLDNVAEYNRALKMGVRAVVSKTDPTSCIITAIEKVAEGEKYNSPIAENLLGKIEGSIELTPRQMAVLQYLAEGLSNKEIGYRLKISMPTVSFHLKEIRQKMDVSTNRQIIAAAVETGLI